MNTFFLFGDYTSEAFPEMSAKRTAEVRELIEKLGGRTRAMYALLGEHDLVFIVECPRMTDAMKASMAINRVTGISFSTAAALPVEEFDRMIDEL